MKTTDHQPIVIGAPGHVRRFDMTVRLRGFARAGIIPATPQHTWHGYSSALDSAPGNHPA